MPEMLSDNFQHGRMKNDQSLNKKTFYRHHLRVKTLLILYVVEM